MSALQPNPQPHIIMVSAKVVLDWLKSFLFSKKKPLRVLHIGNIANNACNNACIQRSFGIEADVLSFNYHHIMGFPEWEDAVFTGEIGDPFFPDWWATSLRGWQRPAWFAGGPVEDCLQYLRLRQAGLPWTAKLLSLHVEGRSFEIMQAKRVAVGGVQRRMPLRLRLGKHLVELLQIAPGAAGRQRPVSMGQPAAPLRRLRIHVANGLLGAAYPLAGPFSTAGAPGAFPHGTCG